MKQGDQQQPQKNEEAVQEDKQPDNRSMFQKFMGLGKNPNEPEQNAEIKVEEAKPEENKVEAAGFGVRKKPEDPFRPKN